MLVYQRVAFEQHLLSRLTSGGSTLHHGNGSQPFDGYGVAIAIAIDRHGQPR